MATHQENFKKLLGELKSKSQKRIQELTTQSESLLPSEVISLWQEEVLSADPKRFAPMFAVVDSVMKGAQSKFNTQNKEFMEVQSQVQKLSEGKVAADRQLVYAQRGKSDALKEFNSDNQNEAKKKALSTATSALMDAIDAQKTIQDSLNALLPKLTQKTETLKPFQERWETYRFLFSQILVQIYMFCWTKSEDSGKEWLSKMLEMSWQKKGLLSPEVLAEIHRQVKDPVNATPQAAVSGRHSQAPMAVRLPARPSLEDMGVEGCEILAKRATEVKSKSAPVTPSSRNTAVPGGQAARSSSPQHAQQQTMQRASSMQQQPHQQPHQQQQQQGPKSGSGRVIQQPQNYRPTSTANAGLEKKRRVMRILTNLVSGKVEHGDRDEIIGIPEILLAIQLQKEGKKQQAAQQLTVFKETLEYEYYIQFQKEKQKLTTGAKHDGSPAAKRARQLDPTVFSEHWCKEKLAKVGSNAAPTNAAANQVLKESVGRQIVSRVGDQTLGVDELHPKEVLLLLEFIHKMEIHVKDAGEEKAPDFVAPKAPSSFAEFQNSQACVEELLDKSENTNTFRSRATGARFKTKAELEQHTDQQFRRGMILEAAERQQLPAKQESRGKEILEELLAKQESRGWEGSIPDWLGAPDVKVSNLYKEEAQLATELAKAQYSALFDNEDEDVNPDDDPIKDSYANGGRTGGNTGFGGNFRGSNKRDRDGNYLFPGDCEAPYFEGQPCCLTCGELFEKVFRDEDWKCVDVVAVHQLTNEIIPNKVLSSCVDSGAAFGVFGLSGSGADGGVGSAPSANDIGALSTGLSVNSRERIHENVLLYHTGCVPNDVR